MGKSKEINNILDECLERLLVKGETIEQCLASYPEQANELEPLLQTALVAKKVSAIQPQPEFRARARYQFRSALRELETKRALPFFSWFPRWATAVIAVVILLLAGGGTVAAAGNSMPDNPLYPVKLATEQVQLTLTTSDIGKATLYAKLADRRVLEIVRMADKGKPKQVERTARRLNTHLTAMVSLAAPREKEATAFMAPPPRPAPGLVKEVNRRAKLRVVLACHAVDHPKALQAVLKRAPASVKPALLRAIAVSETGYEKALKALD